MQYEKRKGKRLTNYISTRVSDLQLKRLEILGVYLDLGKAGVLKMALDEMFDRNIQLITEEVKGV